MINKDTNWNNLLVKAQSKSILEWIRQNNIVNERGDKIEFKNHYFLYDIYEDWTPIQAVKKAAQIGFSTLAILKTLYAAYMKNFNVIYTLPTGNDVYKFVPGKVNQMISSNPMLTNWTMDKDTIAQKKVGDRFIYYQGTFTEREALMLSSDLNIYDEEDRSNSEIISQYQSRLQFSKYKGEWHFSNPSAPNYGTDRYWNKSDQKHWFVECKHCNYWQFLDWEKNVDREREIYVCQKCHKELTDEDRRVGKWVKKWQDKDISGYWISQMMVPWLSCKELLRVEAEKDKQYFYNFVLGLPYIGSDVVVDRDLILRNVTQKQSNKQDVCIGVDVGIEKHVVAGTPFGVFAVFKTNSWEDIENFFLKYDAIMVIDALPDLTEPRKLVQKYKGRVFINYYKGGSMSKEPSEFKHDKQYGVVLSDRTRLIQKAIDELVANNISFHLKPEELGEFITHWESLYRLQDEDKMHNPVIRWESATNVDHYVHAFCYYLIATGRALDKEGAVILERRHFRGRESYFVDEQGQIPAESIKDIVGEPKKDWRTI